MSALLAVSAVVPAPGRSFVTSMPFPNRLVLDLAMRVAGTRPPEAAIRQGVAGGVDAETAGRIVADFHPESAGLYRDRLRGGGLPERRGYVVTGRDAELPAPLQRRFAGTLGAHWTGTIDTGHLPMLEAPTTLTHQIQDFLA
ncbi:pimeloyl-ACP methyl ester carboxylesterase [Catenuloplanes nepalensis]|uniref:Pimeloyl-ACP methyl ester carboxylesterase n=1 Tax=Catenuloplanes nepalensis TaxID=587533 RepID=A0ABT9N7S4_9ACTN|nr:pimeloyl-ACP methyl ester carboxylesterase [Catenuloplanes nepalensis]